MAEKLYIEYRIYLDPSANDATVAEVAEQFKDHIYEMFDDDNPEVGRIPIQDVTYDVIRFPESTKEENDEVQ